MIAEAGGWFISGVAAYRQTGAKPVPPPDPPTRYCCGGEWNSEAEPVCWLCGGPGKRRSETTDAERGPAFTNSFSPSWEYVKGEQPI